MANVLPLTAQKKLWRMYRARFVLVFAILLFILALLAALLIVPSYLALRIAVPPAANVSAAKHAGEAADAVAIGRAQAVVRMVSPVLTASTSPTSVINSALSGRPRGVVVEHVTYVSDSNQLTLSGTASRDAINTYRDVLQKNAYFTSVSVPVSALVGIEGGRFSITLTLAH